MRFRANIGELNEALAVVTHALPSHAAKPILGCVLVECTGDELTFHCSDGAMTILYHTHADVEEEGVVALPGRLFCELMRKLPGSEEGVFDINRNNTLILKCFGSRSTLAGSDGSLFPRTSHGDVQRKVWLSQPLFKEMIDQTVFCVASEDNSRKIITGELLEISRGEALMVAIDGFRMAVRRSAVDPGVEDFSCVVPGRLMNELSKFLSDDEDARADIMLGDKQLRMHIGEHIVVYTSFYEGEFIDYRKILPTQFTTRALIDRARLTSCIERASLFARESKMNLFRMRVTEGKAVITSNSEFGDLYEEFDVETEGEDVDIAFNVRYFTDIMRCLTDERVRIGFNGGLSACAIGPESGDRYAYMVLPVRLHA